MASVGGQNSQWNNFHQTYVFQDGKLSNSTPDVMDENFLSFQLTPTDDAVCEKFCNHRVVYNVSTGVIFDVNHSFENMIQHQWEFKGKCRTD